MNKVCSQENRQTLTGNSIRYAVKSAFNGNTVGVVAIAMSVSQMKPSRSTVSSFLLCQRVSHRRKSTFQMVMKPSSG